MGVIHIDLKDLLNQEIIKKSYPLEKSKKHKIVPTGLLNYKYLQLKLKLK